MSLVPFRDVYKLVKGIQKINSLESDPNTTSKQKRQSSSGKRSLKKVSTNVSPSTVSVIDTYQIGTFSSLGSKHANNEDRTCFGMFQHEGEGYCFAGVFDGHGGDMCSEYVSNNLESHIKEKFLVEDAWERGEEVMNELFHDIDANFYEVAAQEKNFSGSCATVVICKGDDIIVGNIGDCKAVLCPLNAGGSSHGSPVEITVDHRADAAAEELRIMGQGGVVEGGRVLSLQPSRSFGDFDVKYMAGENVVIATPDVDRVFVNRGKRTKKTNGRTRRNSKTGHLRPFLVIGSDGVWDFLDDKTVCNTVKQILKAENKIFGSSTKRKNSKDDWSDLLNVKNEATEAAQKIVELAKAKGSDDDTTAVVVLF